MQTLNIGRESGNQIILNDNLVSRHHAKLTITDNYQVILKDLGSSNGTYVNGNKISEKYLRQGDVVKLGNSMLNWEDYVKIYISSVKQPQLSSEDLHVDFNKNENEINLESSPEKSLSIGTLFNYLSTQILNIGDLFKNYKSVTNAIIFLKGIPVLITLLLSIIFYLKYPETGFFFSPTIIAILIFAVSPFLTVLLLSLYKNASTDKVALASGLMGFLQFCYALLYTFIIFIFLNHFKNEFVSVKNQQTSKLLLTFLLLVCITLFLIIVVAINIFTFKYFKSIGFSNSVSIYMNIICLVLNFTFQLLSLYIVFLIVKDNLNPNYYQFF